MTGDLSINVTSGGRGLSVNVMKGSRSFWSFLAKWASPITSIITGIPKMITGIGQLIKGDSTKGILNIVGAASPIIGYGPGKVKAVFLSSFSRPPCLTPTLQKIDLVRYILIICVKK
jgi:hypothetical protein